MASSSSQPPQTVADLSEAQIIRRFAAAVPDNGTIGIGDDCAVTDGPGGQKQLVSTDLLIEDIHFKLPHIEPGDLGHKALAVNLSDIAAMGGTPNHFFLSLALPETLPVQWLDRFRNGMMRGAQQYKVSLLGGDTTRSPADLMISVMITGLVNPQHLKLRSGAQPGDRLCVTGPLGDSAAGLAILTNSQKYESLSASHRDNLIQWHHHPEPAVQQGRWLGQQSAVHAMIDLSDGLLQDARRLSDQSGCSMDIALDQLPLSPAFEAFCQIDRTSEQAQELAATGGEDYHLLLTVDEAHFSAVARRFEQQFGSALHAIGTVQSGEPGIRTLRNGSPVETSQQQFNHFNRP